MTGGRSVNELPRPEQLVQLFQVLDRVPGRTRVVAGDLGQELPLDSLEYPNNRAVCPPRTRCARQGGAVLGETSRRIGDART